MSAVWALFSIVASILVAIATTALLLGWYLLGVLALALLASLILALRSRR